MKHSWGPVTWTEYGAQVMICARCGLRRFSIKNPDSRTGWSTIYAPADLEAPERFRKVPTCEVLT